MSGEPEAEDQAEGIGAPGTRSDIGVGSADRGPGFGPTGAGTGDTGTAGSLSDAASDTSVEREQLTEGRTDSPSHQVRTSRS